MQRAGKIACAVAPFYAPVLGVPTVRSASPARRLADFVRSRANGLTKSCRLGYNATDFREGGRSCASSLGCTNV